MSRSATAAVGDTHRQHDDTLLALVSTIEALSAARTVIEQGLSSELGGPGELSFDPGELRFSLSVPLSHRLTPA